LRGRAQIAARIPRERRYARALAGDGHRADDLVQDTIERTLTGIQLWRHGSDWRAWTVPFGTMRSCLLRGRLRARMWDALG